ncbi:asparagine synthase (glutamine-hydrolyzing) [Marinobacter sp. NP-4(2019)]|uniref:asparagine synthase (glutamine-hydrolyzing) n=1 Tax=Marinobacter sp. NP-4(2019) TaxID=2488665 RepID=UPI000FC3F194|nr:asparagine synthase (glutamine-hydrolyzing) [Marinobacter sp. NP-4(2019)]AZT85880.1 asparagine synthase (glutamine-hydrolyzing) [Marinobacter sp. NP-4(2019)]
MCGITGVLSPNSGLATESTVRRMADAVLHRGPDDLGTWADSEVGIALGHRRLAILDLSSAGYQPMASLCDRYVIVFNGEIYNHIMLREQLREATGGGIPWRGHSDTETLLEAFRVWGIEDTLRLTSGMFAIAVWDREEQFLTLARDRFGEKPLYYGWVDGTLVFASELKALKQYPGLRGELESRVLQSYLRFGCVGGQQSILKGVFKLPPGSFLEVSLADIKAGKRPQPAEWWSAVDSAHAARQSAPVSPERALTNVAETLIASVERQMAADVPLGAFLSGGVDSSLIVALMQSQSARKIRTFSVGFDDPRYDESEHAAAVARHLGTEHTTLRATSQMALDVIPKLPALYDEPFADSSQIPTFLISSLTRDHVTVALSGDAGDELFGGYNRYVWMPRVWSKLARMPQPMRHTLASLLKSMPPRGYDRLMAIGSRVLPSRLHIRTFGEKLYKLADVLACGSDRELYGGLASMNRHPENLLEPECCSDKAVEHLYPALAGFDQVEWMMLMDTLNFMVDDVLVKVDRASMASSLEVRAPFLDPDVYAAAWQLPLDMRVRNGEGKWALRQILYRHVPRELIERPKMGFAVPLDDWLRGPLREWAEDLLSPSSLANLPALNPRAVQAMWRNHLQGKGHLAQQLWAVLQLSAWAKHWLVS